jgi:hypothetical protein
MQDKDYYKQYYEKNKERLKARSRQWALDNPERRREQGKKSVETRRKRGAATNRAFYYQWRYKEPIENKEARLKEQGFKCANPKCGKVLDLTTGHQDHNHETGELRGVLCNGCNRALGYLGDNADITAGLAEYRSKFK